MKTAGQNRNVRNPRAGVSILELLISLAAMAGIAVILASVLGLTGRALERVSPERQSTDILLARMTLRHWLESMPSSAVLSGTDQTLEFDTLLDEAPFDAVEFARIVTALDSSGAVVLTAEHKGDNQVARRDTLARSNSSLEIEYYGQQKPFQAPDWHTEWLPHAGLPKLVRIEYGPWSRPYPPLVVIPAMDERQSEISLSSPSPPG